MAEGERRYWLPSDDVFQMGQLLAMLLRGDAESLIGVERRQQTALQRRPARDRGQGDLRPTKPLRDGAGHASSIARARLFRAQPLESLEGKTVVFTGPLSIRRFDAEVLVRQAGASISDQVTSRVNVIVQGRRSHDYVMRHKGSKLLAAEKLIRQGVPISIISEPEFFNLVWQDRPRSRASRRVPFVAIHRA